MSRLIITLNRALLDCFALEMFRLGCLHEFGPKCVSNNSKCTNIASRLLQNILPLAEFGIYLKPDLGCPEAWWGPACVSRRILDHSCSSVTIFFKTVLASVQQIRSTWIPSRAHQARRKVQSHWHTGQKIFMTSTWGSRSQLYRHHVKTEMERSFCLHVW